MTTPEQHWEWVGGLLKAAAPLIEYLYTTALKHGVEHGKEIGRRERGSAQTQEDIWERIRQKMGERFPEAPRPVKPEQPPQWPRPDGPGVKLQDSGNVEFHENDAHCGGEAL